MMKKLIYRDEGFENLTRKEMVAAQAALQSLLDCWNELDVGRCTNLFNLVTNPQKAHSTAVSETAEIPVTTGKYQIKKDVFLQMLDVPVPNELYVLARIARKISWSSVPSLWSISEDGLGVEMNSDEADKFINARSIYCENEQQSEFVKHVEQYIAASNWLHDKIINLPGLNTLYSLPWQIEARSFPTLCKLSMSPPQMAEILKSLQ